MSSVVSKGKNWSNEAMQKALQDHRYIKVGGTGGNLRLSGAPGRWKKAESAGDVYVPSLRVAGNPNDIRQLFVTLGQGAAIDRHLAQSYTAQNYQTTMKARFDAEVEAYKAYAAQKEAMKVASGGPLVTLDMLEYLVANAQEAKTVTRASATSPRAATSPGRAGAVQPLAKRLAEARAKGKVLDVSKMDLVKGTQIKMIAVPGANSKKFGVAGLEIVSSDPTTYAAAVRKLGPEYERFIAAYTASRSSVPLAGLSPKARSPTGGLPQLRVPSPVAYGLGALPTVPGALPPIGSPSGSPLM